MGSGLSQTQEEMGENIKNTIDEELKTSIENLPPCDPKYIMYRLYLLKAEAETKKKHIDFHNEGRRYDGTLEKTLEKN